MTTWGLWLVGVEYYAWHGLFIISTIIICVSQMRNSLLKNKWNESGFRPPLCTYRLNWAKRTPLRMVRWLRWHCPPDTGFEIRDLAVWGRARYLSVTEAPHNTDFHIWMGKKHFCFFQTAETGNRTPNSGVKGSGANHHPRAPALLVKSKAKLLPLSLLRSTGSNIVT